MAAINQATRWQTDGKFLRSGNQRVCIHAVTYGPFPGGWPESFDPDFMQISAAGFNALRLYQMPSPDVLDAAARHGLRIFGGLEWNISADFLRAPGLFTAAIIQLTESLRKIGTHPALAGIYVGNEIPADLARWMGPLKVRHAIEELIATGREIAPHLLFAYANYPSTEYLEPENADFTAFNIYLESESLLRSYLRRLHHIAGDRPLVISEFGMDSRRNGEARQAETLQWATRAARDLETAGITLYAWSDRWQNSGFEILDWDFGLVDRSGNPKPALAAVRPPEPPPSAPELSFSVIVCTRNGRSRIGSCLAALGKSQANHETLVVDDGSTDGTADYVQVNFPWVRVIRLDPSGLSAARNAGASAATGDILAFTDDDCQPDREWLPRLAPLFLSEKYAAVGGPNLPPPPRDWEQAVVSAAPGAPSHVLLDDTEAEHLPGCNLAVTRAAFDAIGGFDSRFHTAGDDVDFCWCLRDAGYRLGFVPGAFVWHSRRPSIRAFLRQQLGYGRAERLLHAKHPARFTRHGGPRWDGFIYGGGPVRVMADSVIYHGPMGAAGYQSIVNRMLPLRGLGKNFNTFKSRLALQLVRLLQPVLRAIARDHTLRLFPYRPRRLPSFPTTDEFHIDSPEGKDREHYLALLLARHWRPCDSTDLWDLEHRNTRILMATERGQGIAKRTLIRLSGPTSAQDIREMLENGSPIPKAAPKQK